MTEPNVGSEGPTAVHTLRELAGLRLRSEHSTVIVTQSILRLGLATLDAARATSGEAHEGPTPRDCPECQRLHDA